MQLIPRLAYWADMDVYNVTGSCSDLSGLPNIHLRAGHGLIHSPAKRLGDRGAFRGHPPGALSAGSLQHCVLALYLAIVPLQMQQMLPDSTTHILVLHTSSSAQHARDPQAPTLHCRCRFLTTLTPPPTSASAPSSPEAPRAGWCWAPASCAPTTAASTSRSPARASLEPPSPWPPASQGPPLAATAAYGQTASEVQSAGR